MAKVVVALGGNALGKSPEEQLKLVKNTASSLIGLIAAGNQVVISHGNGPQVGAINLGMNFAAEHGKTAAFPFPECGAMSQGYIGYHLQQSLENELHRRWMNKSVATIVTQIAVDPDDPAFNNPSKPVGDFYSKEQADEIAKEKGYTFKEDAGRGYRQVVPSPLPMKIMELDSIKTLIDADKLVIAGGGGGGPRDRFGGVCRGHRRGGYRWRCAATGYRVLRAAHHRRLHRPLHCQAGRERVAHSGRGASCGLPAYPGSRAAFHGRGLRDHSAPHPGRGRGGPARGAQLGVSP